MQLQPINILDKKLSKLFTEFFNSEKAGGLILIACTAVSLIIANSGVGENYQVFWNTKLAGLSIGHWINDGLMAVFFLLVGLELEREIYKGELSNIKDALLPMFAAIGGIVVPAAVYLFFNYGTVTQSGIGIPMATDIAFALGVLSLLGNRVPTSLKIFLTALAVIDDLCAILVIAVFYTKTLVLSNLFISLVIFAALLILNRMKIKILAVYLIGGLTMWFFMFNSGVHATISGVLLAFAIPFGTGEEQSISYKLQHFLHKPVAFFILPVFALANTAILFGPDFGNILTEKYSLGIALGLIAGKPVGILLLSSIAVGLGICKLPADISWKHIIGAGFLAGIGFTMSIFITLLAFDNTAIVNNAKLVILLASLVAGLLGFLLLKFSLKSVTAADK